MTVLEAGVIAREQAMTARDLPQLAGVEHRFLDVGGLRTHVALAGSGEPLLLLHGWPQHWWQWRHLIDPLAQRFRVICPDLRGLGWTDAPPTGYRPAAMADDITGLLDRLGIDHFHAIGHDWGGLVGYLLALRFPERMRHYIAINTVSPFRFEVFVDAGHFPATEQPGRVAELALEFFGQKSPPSNPSKPPKSP